MENLHLQALDSRRKFFDIDFILKTFCNQINSSEFIEFFTFPPRTRVLRCHTSFLVSLTNNSSINRCMKVFNDLKLDINHISNLPYSRGKRIVLDALNSWSCSVLVDTVEQLYFYTLCLFLFFRLHFVYIIFLIYDFLLIFLLKYFNCQNLAYAVLICTE